MVSESMDQLTRPRPRSFLVPDFNFKFKSPRRRAATDTDYRRQSNSSSISDSSRSSISSSSEPTLNPIRMTEEEEDDFFDMLTKFQSSRIDDQRMDMPVSLLKHQQLKMEIGEANEDKKEIEPIKQVLELGAPYPMVVLPVDGEYWMEGNYHILSRDLNDRPIFPTIDMSRCTLAEDNSVYNYKRNFAGKEHLNFAAIDNKHGPVLLSVILDLSIDDDIPDQYRVVLRLKERSYDVVIPTATFVTDPGPRDFLKHMLPDFDFEIDRFHPVSQLRASDDITKFDEHTVTNCYKVGVVLQKLAQTTEEDFLQNQGETPAFREFLDFLGTRVDLQDFPNYRGGLDVKHGQTGDESYYANYKNKELMFHVSTLLPYSDTDSQQLGRKRHIGNDVVSIIFQEENTPFCPSAFRSHFLHVFIIVQVEDPCTENTRYKVSITAKEGVPKFAPTLPNPCIFKKGPEFRNFLLTKVLNAEMAAVKSKKFSALAERTRTMLLQGLVNEFISKNEKQLEDDSSNTTTHQEISSKPSSGSILQSFRSALEKRKETSESNLERTNSSGQSLSLNDMSSISSTESNNNGESKKHTKDKKKNKKDKRLSSDSISPRSHSPTNYVINGCGGDVSPTLLHSSSTTSSKQKSRFYTNQLFGDCEALSPNSTHSLPRNLLSMNGRHSPVSPRLYRPVSHIQTTNNNVETSDEHKIDMLTAQLEIEKLKAEVNKLKMDKMDLVRQNVTHQQEIKKLNERTSSHVVDSYTHQLKSMQNQSKKFHYGSTVTTITEFV